MNIVLGPTCLISCKPMSQVGDQSWDDPSRSHSPRQDQGQKNEVILSREQSIFALYNVEIVFKWL